MKIKASFAPLVGASVTVFPGLYFGRSGRSWWLYVVFLTYRFGIKADEHAH